MPTVIRLLEQTDVIDIPVARSSHAVPTPRGGGIACVGGIISAAMVTRLFGGRLNNLVVLPSLALAAVGYFDDVVGLPPMPRLAAQIVVGSVSGMLSGRWRGLVAGAIVVPVVVNTMNFMDGINGISAATLSGWALTVSLAGQRDASLALEGVGEAALGAAAGFAPWNVPDARVFLGDVGSYLFGGLVASSAILVVFGEGRARLRPGALVLSPLAYYFVDAGGTLLVRLARGEKLTEAHRSHVYQRVASFRGVEHWHVAVGAGLLSLLGGTFGLLSQKGR